MSLEMARELGCHLRHINVGRTGVIGSPMDSDRYQATIYLDVPTTKRLLQAEIFILRTIGIVRSAGASKLADLNQRLLLADPTFYQPRGIDVVVGADSYKSCEEA